MLRKLKRQIPGKPLAVPGRGPAVEKHWFSASRCSYKETGKRYYGK